MTIQQAQALRDNYVTAINGGALSEDCNTNWNAQDSADMLGLLYSISVPANLANKVAFYLLIDICLMSAQTLNKIVGTRPNGTRGSK